MPDAAPPPEVVRAQLASVEQQQAVHDKRRSELTSRATQEVLPPAPT